MQNNEKSELTILLLRYFPPKEVTTEDIIMIKRINS